MKNIIFVPKLRETLFSSWLILLLFTAGMVYTQEDSSSDIKLVPSQERIPRVDWRINPEYVTPPAGNPQSPPVERSDVSPSPVVRNSAPFKAPLVSELQRGKWYVQIGVYTRADHVEDAINRIGTSDPVVIQIVGTDTDPMLRVLLGPFTRNESKTMLQRFRDKGYDAFLRSGN
jgi:hypothetical protein